MTACDMQAIEMSLLYDLEFREEYESEDTDEPDESPYADFVY